MLRELLFQTQTFTRNLAIETVKMYRLQHQRDCSQLAHQLASWHSQKLDATDLYIALFTELLGSLLQLDSVFELFSIETMFLQIWWFLCGSIGLQILILQISLFSGSLRVHFCSYFQFVSRVHQHQNWLSREIRVVRFWILNRKQIFDG